jgi:glycosyltransferase involved in cell wall biosynthesis
LHGSDAGKRMERPTISAIIPAYNEEKTVGEVVSQALIYTDEVIVVDDGSTDDTPDVARHAGAEVVHNEENRGVLVSLARGFRAARGDVLVTLDADGQHDPDEIPILLEPILGGRADLVLGKRPRLPHLSERVITGLTRLKVDINDASTGFRAVRREFADRMLLHGSCTCGTFILEASSLGARIVEVPITVREREEGERRIQTRHFTQVLYVLYDLLRY